MIRSVTGMKEYDLYDVLAELGYGLAPRTRAARAEAFGYKHARWLDGLPTEAAATMKAMASQFSRAGTDGLETSAIFQTPEVKRAGGLSALKALGKPAEVLRETKARMFAA
jgi:type I restriction enzyme R subunit